MLLRNNPRLASTSSLQLPHAHHGALKTMKERAQEPSTSPSSSTSDAIRIPISMLM